MKRTVLKKPFSLLIIVLWICVMGGIPTVIRAEYHESDSVNATVKLSVCGNQVAEPGEDCDDFDFQGITCQRLGFAQGTLTCSSSCNFQTTPCIAPAINPNAVLPDQLNSLLATGLMTVPTSVSWLATSTSTVTSFIRVLITADAGIDTITFPKSTIITTLAGTTYDPTAMIATPVSTNQVAGLMVGTTAQKAIYWGVPGTALAVNQPITLSLQVDSALDGKTLQLWQSTTLDSGWTNDKINAPANCVVNEDRCSFTTTVSGYFVATKINESNSTTGDGTVVTQTTIAVNAPSPSPVVRQPTVSLSRLFSGLNLAFYTSFLDPSGEISPHQLYTVIKQWVDHWRSSSTDVCDINADRQCTVQDLSVLLYHVKPI